MIVVYEVNVSRNHNIHYFFYTFTGTHFGKSLPFQLQSD